MRKKIKKTVSYLLAVLIAGSISNSFIKKDTNINYDGTKVFAEESTDEKGPVLTAEIKDQKKYFPGDTFVMQIRVTENEEGYNGLRSNILVDNSVFEIIEWNEGDPDEENYKKTPQKLNTTCICQENENGDATEINQLYFDLEAENFTGDNVFSTITFKIKESANPGIYKINIEPTDSSKTFGNRVVKKDKKDVVKIIPEYIGTEIEIVSKENTVTETTGTEKENNSEDLEYNDITGDINSDGVVNSEDVTILSECLLEIIHSEDYRKADINEDNVVNILDLIRLKKIVIDN